MEEGKRLLRVVIGSDHGALTLKNDIAAFLSYIVKHIEDIGAYTTDTVDYPDISAAVCDRVLKGEADYGIVLCGTGIGASIAANKIRGIRCALCHDHYTAKMSRVHNDANVLAIGGRTCGLEVAKEMVNVFLSTEYEGGRHQNRLNKIRALETK